MNAAVGCGPSRWSTFFIIDFLKRSPAAVCRSSLDGRKRRPFLFDQYILNMARETETQFPNRLPSTRINAFHKSDHSRYFNRSFCQQTAICILERPSYLRDSIWYEFNASATLSCLTNRYTPKFQMCSNSNYRHTYQFTTCVLVTHCRATLWNWRFWKRENLILRGPSLNYSKATSP